MDRQTAEHAMQVLWEHLALLRPYLEDAGTQEVMINSPSDIWIEGQGVMKRLSITLDPDQVDAVIRILSGINNKPDAFILDCRLPGLRIAAARHPIAVHGHAMCFRKHTSLKLAIADYVTSGAFTPLLFDRVPGGSSIPPGIAEDLPKGQQALADFLTWAVRARKTCIISGSTSSGKTTLVGATLDLVQKEDRVVVIEDTGELSDLDFDLPNRVHLESNESLGVSIRDLVRLSLRFRPTRIIIGEIRGAEGFDMLNAYGTGHEGGLVTLHADNGHQALISLETKIRMAPEARELPLASLREQIAQTFSYVIHAANVIGVQPSSAPVEIVEVLGVKEGFYATRLLYSRFIS